MSVLLSRYATPFVTGFFLVSLVSGLALFFHIGPSGFHGMHEILSLVLIVPFALHIWKNWRPMTCYLKRTPMAVALGLSLAAAVPFLIPTGDTQTGGRPPQFALVRTQLAATPEAVAPALNTTPEALLTALRAAGFTEAAPGVPLTRIAETSGMTENALAAALVAAHP